MQKAKSKTKTTSKRTGLKTSAAAKTKPSGKKTLATRNKRTSVGNAKARSQRSVKNAERRSTGPVSVGSSKKQNTIWEKPRSQRIHPGRARKNQGVKSTARAASSKRTPARTRKTAK